jgi:glycosyltransferase involved in cell wall biosynthesis
MESVACGTPVLTFKTGGSPEMLNEKCGAVVEKNDVEGLIKEILRIAENNPFDKADLLAQAKTFDMNDRFAEYIRLYKQ